MLKKILFFLLLLIPFMGFAQTETHNFTTYDTTYTDSHGTWIMRISRPVNMFTPGNADTASRPVIFMMPGQGEMGNSNPANLVAYGPHFWMNNGWDGGFLLGNGKHYPIIITVSYTNNVFPYPSQYYSMLVYMLNHYHIKRNSVYLMGLSQGAFTQGGVIEYEGILGDQAGMKLIKAMLITEGTPTTPANESPVRAMPCSTAWCDTVYYKTWATTYGGKYFYLEGSGADNFRDGWHYATAMNNSVTKSAYFSYENLGGGAHCCWNQMYDPSATNWSCVTPLGPNNAPSQAGTNQMGNYRVGQSTMSWLFSQGDTSLVGGPIGNLTVSAGPDQTITLPTNSISVAGSATPPTGAVISSYLWFKVSGGSANIFAPTAASTTINNLVAGNYVFALMAVDNFNDTAYDSLNVTVNPNSCRAFVVNSSNTNINITNSSIGATLHGCDTVYVPPRAGGYRSFSFSGIGTPSEGAYIHIIFQPGAFITPNSGGNLFANQMDNSNWVHIYGANMSNHTDPFMFKYVTTGYSHRIWWDSITLRNTGAFFPSGPITTGLADFTGNDTTNCFYAWRFSKVVLVGSGDGATALWLGSIAKNNVWVNVEIDHSFFGDYPSQTVPACYIHAQNVYGLYIHDDSLWNLGNGVLHPTGHAAQIFIQACYFDIYNNHFGPNNFGNEIRSIGAGCLINMGPQFLLWDANYTGISRVHNNIVEHKRKYPFLETQTDPSDINTLPYYQYRRAPLVDNITFFRGGMGANNNSYYNLSTIDAYKVTGTVDTIHLYNSVQIGPPTDTTINVCTSQGCNALFTFPSGAIANMDTANNLFSQGLNYATSGLSDTIKFIPLLNGPMYNSGSNLLPYVKTDIYGNPLPTLGRQPFALNTGVDKGAVQFFTPVLPGTIIGFIHKRGQKWVFTRKQLP